MRIPLPDDLDGRGFSVETGRAAGLGRNRLNGPDLSAPFWGIRVATPLVTAQDFATAYATRMPAGAFFSHQTAASILGIPLPFHASTPLPLHVSSVAALRGPTGEGTVGHHLQIDPIDVIEHSGLVVTGLERTVFDLAATLDDEALLAALDNILWHRRAASLRATHESLADAFTRFHGRRGRSRLLELMPLACDRSDAPPESAFRLRFRRAGFPPAIPNERVYDAHGRFLAMPDLQFRGFRMAFDYEGDYHRTDQAQWRKDLARVPRLQDDGWHHTRISGDDLQDPSELLHRTRRILIQRGWRPPR